jgi:hypothetical protein
MLSDPLAYKEGCDSSQDALQEHLAWCSSAEGRKHGVFAAYL